MPFINEAVYALRDGVADAEAIDTVAKLGFAHPIGPLALADLIGLDTCVAIMEVLRAGSATRSTRRARCSSSTSQAGRLGRKSGEGFYRYERGRRARVEQRCRSLRRAVRRRRPPRRASRPR